MAGDWRETVLGTVVAFSNGQASPERADDLPYPVYGSNGIIGYAAVTNAQPHSIVIGRVGTYCGSLHYVKGPSWVTENAIRATAIGDNDPRYAYYLLATLKLNERRAGSGQPLLNHDILSRIEVAIPDSQEQRAIAHILGTLDDKIELNRRMSETLEEMARALFESWFVRFDPVRAKMEGRDPGLPSDLADLFPDRLVYSELGEIPEGWELGTLADVADLNPEVWTKDARPPTIRYVELSGTKWGRIDEIKEYSAFEAPSRAQRVLRPGDTIVGTVRPGNGSFALISQEGLTGSTGFAVLRPRATEFTEFVYLAATARDNIEWLAHVADGAAYPAVRPEVVAGTPVALPPIGILQRFSSLARVLFARSAAAIAESRTLAALRDTLLPKLISGELRVKDAERLVAATT